MFRHHEREKQLTEAERETLLSQGAVTQGTVMHNEPSAADLRISQVRISVRFKDDQTAEFSEELPNLYQPAPGSPDARRLAEVGEARQLRKNTGLTQAQVAAVMGDSQARISQIEHGKVTEVDAIRGYVEALGGTVDVVARVGDWTVKVA